MSKGKDAPTSHVVDDPAAAFRRLEDATRKILSTPKQAPPPASKESPKDRPN